MCVWECTWKPDVDIGVSHSYLPPHLLRQCISLNPEISCVDQLSRVAGQPWRIASLYFFTVRSTDMIDFPWTLWRGRCLNSHSCACVCEGPFTDWAVSPATGSPWLLNSLLDFEATYIHKSCLHDCEENQAGKLESPLCRESGEYREPYSHKHALHLLWAFKK